jgi:GNAT superfamily N-acetyltransferase
MIKLVRTDSDNNDFIQLVALLDRDLAIRDGEEHAFYAQFNKTNLLKNVVVAFDGDTAVGCGAFRPYETNTVEVKRMFVQPEQRGKGIAGMVLAELEKWAAELNITTCVLETGKKQPEAIGLYQKSGYSIIPSYGQYINVENSVCMKKVL